MYGRQVTKKDLATLVQQMDSNMDFESAVELVDKLLAQHPDGDTQAVRKILEFEMMEALMESEVRDEQDLLIESLVNLMRIDNADPDEVLGDFPENIQEAVRSRMQFEDEFAADDYAGDYMVQSDVARIMDSAARLTMMTPPDETYSEWWKSQLSVVADKIDGLADYLEDRYADETDGMDAETFEAKSMTKSEAKKKFVALMKPYWLKDLKESRGPKLSRKQHIAKHGDDEWYDAHMEDWEWWNNHVKTVQSGKYGDADIYGDTVLREALPYSYYTFINYLPIKWEGSEKYDDDPYDLENLYDDETHACILDGEPSWEEYSTADKRKLNALEKRLDSDKISSEEYYDTWDKITSKYSTQKFHKNEASRVNCRHCGPVIKAMNNMNNWDILSVAEKPDFYAYWEYPAALKKQVKALIPALKGVKVTKPKKAPTKAKSSRKAPKTRAKTTAKKSVAKPKAKAKSGRKGPDISATKRKIGTRMRGNDGKMWEVKPAGKSQRWVRGAETFEASRGSRGNRGHQMMTKELSSKIPKLYSQEEVSDPTVVAHYFTPYGRGDWFVIEWDGEDMMYGLADLGYPELGYFSLSELESAYRGGLPLVERDLYWTPVPLSEVQKTRMASEEDSAPIQRPMDFGEPVNWTPHDGTPSLRKRQRAEEKKLANEPVPAADYEFYYRSLLE